MKTMKRMLTIAMVCAVAGSSFGCKGQMGLLMKANPSTEVWVDPITKRLYIYSNDGRSVRAEGVEAGVDAEGKRYFKADLIDMPEKSVEVKDADTRAIAATERLFQTAIRETALGVAMGIREGLAPIRGASGSIDTPIGKGSLQLGGGTKATEPAPGPEPLDRVE